MTELHELDAAARRRALTVDRSFIVQAPAGSGKTELLTQRFLALLATVERPESVLAITFTRKAAAEMRERILSALREARHPGTQTRALRPQTLQLAAIVVGVDRQLRWGLLENPSRLRILTIDALNLSLARRLPVLSGLGAEFGIAEDSTELLELAAEQVLRHVADGSDPHAAPVAALLLHRDNRAGELAELIVQMLRRREAWLPALPSWSDEPGHEQALRTALDGARARPVREHLRLLQRSFEAPLLQRAMALAQHCALNLARDGADTLIVHCLDAATPGVTTQDLATWQGLAELLLTQEGKPRAVFTKSQGVAAGKANAAFKAELQTLAHELRDAGPLASLLHESRLLPPSVYDEREWAALRALLVVLRLAAAELELVFAERGVVDYPRVAQAALDALGPPEAPTDTALAFDAQLQHLLVDEFQDTSQSQVRLLQRLTAGWQDGDGRSVFLVGDPMQSIYRFRNAEVGLFIDIRDHGLGSLSLEPLRLAVNFRSTQPIVDWVNTSFASLMSDADDALRGAVKFTACSPAPAAPVQGGVQLHALIGRSRAEEAREVVAIAARRLAESAQARVAVLVQGRMHLIDIVAELQRKGIAYLATDIDPLARRPVVLDLLALTRAMAQLADRTAWLSVLRSPICGLELAELQVLCDGGGDAPMIELLRDPARRARLEAPARARLERTLQVLERGLEERARFGLTDAVERAWQSLGGPAAVRDRQALAEARAYLDELARLERDGGGHLAFDRLQRALERLYTPPDAGAGARVELMTIHKAKGLQFDTVIVPGLERSPRREDQSLLRWTRLPDAHRADLVVAPIEAVGGEEDALYAWLGRLEQARRRQEHRRLLYVAATRAERELHLFGSAQVLVRNGAPQTLRAPRHDCALRLLWPLVEAQFAARLDSVQPERAVEQRAVRRPVLQRLPDAWQPPPPPEPPVSAPAGVRSVSGRLEVEFDWAGETARYVGTVVHRELQRLSLVGAQRAQPRTQAVRFEIELAELGVPVDRREQAVQRVLLALEKTLADPRGRWLLDTTHGSSGSELALSGPIEGQVVRILIDRSFIDGQGRRWVVDYKTSSHEGAGLEAFLDRESERYRAQLDRYATLLQRLDAAPLMCGLYFPLLSAWREWPA